jgi:mRNA-degrading endonuclease RelE of RelBE toxin-antitoxin system
VSVRPEFAPYTVEIRRGLEKQLDQVSDQDALRIVEALERLGIFGIGDVKDVGQDYPGRYRLRVGHWRIYFNVTSRTIDAVALEKRGEAYKRRSRNK